MITRRVVRVASAVLALPVALALAACSGYTTGAGETAEAAAVSPQQLTAHEWVLNRSASSLDAPGTTSVTLAFAADDQLTGQGPCNGYGGEYALDAATLTISKLSQTQRACADAVNQAETEYMALLAGAHSVDASDANRLVLSSSQGRLTYDALDLKATITGDWQVVNVAEGDAIQSTLPDTDPVLSLNSDGSLGLTTGCNGFSSSWALTGDVITIPPARSTLKACSSPTGVMEQESALGAALDAAHQVQATPEQLTLLNKEGQIVLVATKGTSA